MKQDEIRRLREGAEDPLPRDKYLVSFIARCNGRAVEALERCKQVLSLVLQPDADDWPSIDEWRTRLPEWFVENSAEEITQEEAERRLQLPLEERLKLSQRWSVSAFVHWFQPSERYWYWWDAKIDNANTLRVWVIADDEPFPWGALDWLLRASGALSVEQL